MQGVQDDKTVVGLINTDAIVDDRDECFYQEPDWQKLQDAWNRKAYPHLYAQDTKPITNEKKDDLCGEGHSAEITKTESEEKKTKDNQTEEGKQESFVPLIQQPESDRARQAMAAYGRTSRLVPPKTDQKSKNQSSTVQGSDIKKETLMERHDKPKKKGIIGKIGDALA